MALDSDVYWKSAPAASTEWYATPTFQNSGETTLPADLVLFNTVLRNGYSSGQGDAMWGQGIGRTNRIFPSHYQRFEDNADYSDAYRTCLKAYPYAAVRSGSTQEMCRSNNWGHLNDGRSIPFTQVAKTNSYYSCVTSLRFNPMPFMLRNFCTPATTDANWKLNFGFAPDWVWAYTTWKGNDSSEWDGNWNSVHGYYSETFSHRDGTMENWNLWSEDNQGTSDCGSNYMTTKFMEPWWNGSVYTDSFDSITYNDDGVTLDWQTANTSYQSVTFLAGKNENSKVGSFRPLTSDYGDGVYRSSDNTIKVTTGFKPKMVFFMGGKRNSEGHTTSIQNGRGFASETDQWAQSMSERDNMTYTDVYHSNANDKCFRRLYYYSTTTEDELSLNAMESDGFRLNLDNSGNYNISYLALGDPPVAPILPYQPSILSV